LASLSRYFHYKRFVRRVDILGTVMTYELRVTNYETIFQSIGPYYDERDTLGGVPIPTALLFSPVAFVASPTYIYYKSRLYEKGLHASRFPKIASDEHHFYGRESTIVRR
jgi:hypothetical protein